MTDFIKYLTPFILFALGIYVSPFIEGLKEKRMIDSKIKSLFQEIDDEYEILIKSIHATNKSIQNRMYKPKDFVSLSLPMPLNLRVLSSCFDIVYPKLDKDVRKALKVILLCQKTINENNSSIEISFRDDNLLCLAKEKAMLKSMLSAYYLLSELKNKNKNFKYPEITNSEIWEKSAKSLNIKLM